MEAVTECPYCGEELELEIDAGDGGEQRYIEDCQVCCRPIEFSISIDGEGEPIVSARRDDD